MKRVCGWCSKLLGYKQGVGTTHGICDRCLAKAIKEMKEVNKEGEKHGLIH